MRIRRIRRRARKVVFTAAQAEMRQYYIDLVQRAIQGPPRRSMGERICNWNLGVPCTGLL